jgi:ribosomal protein L16/L10AE
MDTHASYRLCQIKVTQTAEKYIMMYYSSTTIKNRNAETARDFMNKHYKAFRREIVEIGIDTLYSCDFSKEAQKAVQENYRFAVMKLFIEIVIVCNETKFIENN